VEIFSLQVDYTPRGSNPWDTVHAACDLVRLFPLHRNRPLAAEWQPLPVRLNTAKRRADAMRLGASHWAVRLAASRALAPILGPAAEFLPLACESGEELVALHALQMAELGPGAEGSRNPVTGRLDWVRRYDFEPAALAAMVCFRAREPVPIGDGVFLGIGAVLVPDPVRERIEGLGVAGWRFEQVFPMDKRRLR
jgi:hypothetical protein